MGNTTCCGPPCLCYDGLPSATTYTAHKSSYPAFSPSFYGKVRVVKVIDGDTFNVLGRLRKGGPLAVHKCRLRGVDCPETKSSNPHEAYVSKLAAAFVSRLLLDKTVKLEQEPATSALYKRKGKFGRLLVDVRVRGRLLSQALLETHLAVSYDGKTKAPFTPTFLAHNPMPPA